MFMHRVILLLIAITTYLSTISSGIRVPVDYRNETTNLNNDESPSMSLKKANSSSLAQLSQVERNRRLISYATYYIANNHEYDQLDQQQQQIRSYHQLAAQTQHQQQPPPYPVPINAPNFVIRGDANSPYNYIPVAYIPTRLSPLTNDRRPQYPPNSNSPSKLIAEAVYPTSKRYKPVQHQHAPPSVVAPTFTIPTDSVTHYSKHLPNGGAGSPLASKPITRLHQRPSPILYDTVSSSTPSSAKPFDQLIDNYRYFKRPTKVFLSHPAVVDNVNPAFYDNNNNNIGGVFSTTAATPSDSPITGTSIQPALEVSSTLRPSSDLESTLNLMNSLHLGDDGGDHDTSQGYEAHQHQHQQDLSQQISPANIKESIRTLSYLLKLLQKVDSISESQPKYQLITEQPSSSSILDDHSGEGGTNLNLGLGSKMVKVPHGTLTVPILPKPIPIRTQTQQDPHIDDDANENTPGRAGIDYPTYYEIPVTSFSCKTQRYKGFFADPDTKCQVWHYCDLNGGQASFLCPNGTIFSQGALTCDWWFNVKCSFTHQLYVLNERLYKYIIPAKPSFPEDYSGPLVDQYLTEKFRQDELREQLKANETVSTTEESPSSSTIKSENEHLPTE